MSTKNTAKKRGRPSRYSPAVAARICREVASGATLPQICSAPGMPVRASVYKWLCECEGFSDNYARARRDRADARADKIDGIVQDVLAGKVDAQAARVAIDAHKWLAGKEQPKRYGDKLDLQHSGSVEIEMSIGGDDAE